MKKIVFITIAAALALVVSSCKKSTEEEPQVEPIVAPITIDGKYSDWDKLVADGKAYVSNLKISKVYDKEAMKKLVVYADATHIYFMISFDQRKTLPLYIFFATKGEVPTDAINLWNPCYVDYCIEFGRSDNFVDDPSDMDYNDWTCQQLMAYDHQKGGYSWTNLSQNMVTLSNKTTYSGNTAVEGKIARSNFTFTTSYFYIGAYVSNSAYAPSGAQPAATIEDELVVLPEMMKVNLP